MEVVQRTPGVAGFKVIPRRWVVERTFGWLMHHRRLARDYETHPHRSEAIIHVAMIDLISRRLTRESTPQLARHLNLEPNNLAGTKRSLSNGGVGCCNSLNSLPIAQLGLASS